MFSNFKNIDVNIKRDISKEEDTGQTYTWFTILLNRYVEIDDETDKEEWRYEYVSFPCNATDDSHIRFYTLDYPYMYSTPFRSTF